MYKDYQMTLMLSMGLMAPILAVSMLALENEARKDVVIPAAYEEVENFG